MSQQQPPLPPRAALSPNQGSPSPTVSSPGVQTGTTRAILSPTNPQILSRPTSPYPLGQLARTSGSTTPVVATPTSGHNQPTYGQNVNHQHQQSVQPQYQSTPSFQQINRSASPGKISLPTTTPPNPSATSTPAPLATVPLAYHQDYPASTPGLQQPQQQGQHQYTQQSFAVNQNARTGPMGPPNTGPFPSYVDATRQMAPKQPSAKSYTYDMDDTLAGTGINLEEEEQFMNDFETRSGFATGLPGDPDSFYGAGQLNQPHQQMQAETPEELAAKARDEVWRESAYRLAASRAQIQRDWFVEPGWLHKRMHDIAGENNLQLNLDLKNAQQPVGRAWQPVKQEKAEIRVQTQRTQDGTIVQTCGSFIPTDAYLIDQMALMALGVKEYVGSIIGEADKVAVNRQQTSHGVIPPDWMDIATSQPPIVKDSNTAMDVDSAVSPSTNPLKRSVDAISTGLPTPTSETPPTNPVIEVMLDIAKRERDLEEARLRKRQKRAEEAAAREKKEDGHTSRSGSVAPGTPGLPAGDQAEVKTLTKKESKKAAKLAEATSSTVNSTLNQFMGRKGKKYSWLSGGGGAAGSGASTPRLSGAGISAGGGGNRPSKGRLTQPGHHNLGGFHENSEKGKNIQLRDLVHVLEDRGMDRRALQTAYLKLDRSDFGDRVNATNNTNTDRASSFTSSMERTSAA